MNTTRELPSLKELGDDLLHSGPIRIGISLLVPFVAAGLYFGLAFHGHWVPAFLCVVYLSFCTYASSPFYSNRPPGCACCGGLASPRPTLNPAHAAKNPPRIARRPLLRPRAVDVEKGVPRQDVASGPPRSWSGILPSLPGRGSCWMSFLHSLLAPSHTEPSRHVELPLRRGEGEG